MHKPMPMPVSNRIVERVRAGVLAQRHMGAGVADDIPVHAHVQGARARARVCVCVCVCVCARAHVHPCMLMHV